MTSRFTAQRVIIAEYERVAAQFSLIRDPLSLAKAREEYSRTLANQVKP